MNKHLAGIVAAIAVIGALAVPAAADSTRVPGHDKDRQDMDGNGVSDGGVYVNGHYTSVYAYDDAADWYWDLGDGRILGSVLSIDALDEATLTVCDYVINYRADFGNDPFMDHGWIQNHIGCRGYDDNSRYNYLIVSDTDRRYTGDPEWAIWGTWEFHVQTISGEGNVTRTQNQIALLLMVQTWLGARATPS
jgi:hypothetical protein